MRFYKSVERTGCPAFAGMHEKWREAALSSSRGLSS